MLQIHHIAYKNSQFQFPIDHCFQLQFCYFGTFYINGMEADSYVFTIDIIQVRFGYLQYSNITICSQMIYAYFVFNLLNQRNECCYKAGLNAHRYLLLNHMMFMATSQNPYNSNMLLSDWVWMLDFFGTRWILMALFTITLSL